MVNAEDVNKPSQCPLGDGLCLRLLYTPQKFGGDRQLSSQG